MQLNTKKKIPKVLQKITPNGDVVSPYGTLVGHPVFDECPTSTRDGYLELIKKMNNTEGCPESFCKKELVRLWDIHYAFFSDMDGQFLLSIKENGNLVTMSRFVWYEAYVNKLCQFEETGKSDFLENLYSVGSLMADIYADSKVPFCQNTDFEYESMTCTCILANIARYLGETSSFVVVLENYLFKKDEDIMAAVREKKVCNALFNLDLHNSSDGAKTFGVAVLGVPFIRNLTEEEAAYVFATASDVFSFNPDQVNLEKSNRIYLLNEFMRRHLLCMRDFTKDSKSILLPIKYLAAKFQTLRSNARGEKRQEAIEGLKKARRQAEEKVRKKNTSLRRNLKSSLSQSQQTSSQTQ